MDIFVLSLFSSQTIMLKKSSVLVDNKKIVVVEVDECVFFSFFVCVATFVGVCQSLGSECGCVIDQVPIFQDRSLFFLIYWHIRGCPLFFERGGHREHANMMK